MITVNGIFAMAKIMTDDADASRTYCASSAQLVRLYAERSGLDYAVAQVEQLLNQKSFEGCTIRLMPDIHPGKVCPIGFSSTLGSSVMPEVVGTDIGCGMTMAKLRKGRLEFEKLDGVIRSCVPHAASGRANAHRYAEKFEFDKLHCSQHIDIGRAGRAIGTLGGGNHFIEIDKSKKGETFCTVHSGSRYLGMAVAEHYQRKGQQILKDKGVDIPYELAYIEGSLMEDYLHDVRLVTEFARLNREAIMDELAKGMKWKFEGMTSCIHNYIDFAGEKPIIRKGAISARKGEDVIIPINMKDGVIIGKGLGNEEWNFSAPHGAGRIMSRAQVAENYTVSQFKKEMKGIYSMSVGKGTLDEAPFAYRRLESILPKITETVEVEDVLKPVYSFKAGGDEK